MKYILKGLFLDYWQYIIIAILTLLLFRNCQDNEKLQLSNDVLKKDIKISELQVDKYAKRINLLNDRITILETAKTSEKTKIVTVVKEVEKKIQSVGNLSTNGIATFYSNRYKLKQVTITQYGVALKDTVHKMVIVDLIKKDGLVLELNHTKNILNLTENQSKIKDEVIVFKDSINAEKDKQIDSHIAIEKNLTKQVKSEKTKKTVWQLISGGILVGAGYLLIR